MATITKRPLPPPAEPEEYLLALTRAEARALRRHLAAVTETHSPTDTIFHALYAIKELHT